MVEILKALAPLGIWVSVIIVCLTLIIGIAAVVFGGLNVEFGSEKWFMLKMSKQPKTAASMTPVLQFEPIPEPALVSSETKIAIPHEPVPQEPESEDEQKEGTESRDRDTFWNYISARNLSDLDASFDPFMASLSPEQIEFWQTEYLKKRESYGADRAREALRDLLAQQPTWAYPYAILLNWALREHNFEEAKRYLDTGLTKTQSPQFGHVLNAGVELIFKTESKQAALEFACKWSKADLSESIRAGAFAKLADLLKESGNAEGHRVALEFASNLQPSNMDRMFTLGYSYAENNARWASAIWHYQKCLNLQIDGPIAQNNVGIIYSHIDKAVAIQTYERAKSDGDKFSPANLAHLLIEDGYVAIAQALLDGVEDSGNAAENHAAAKTAALTARRRAETKLNEITEAARLNNEPYKISLAAALRNLQRSDTQTLEGFFATTDRKGISVIDSEKAICQLRVGTSVFEGTLQNQVTCFAGWLSAKGGSLLTSDVSQFTLLYEGDGVFRLFRWPNTIGLQNRVVTYELRQVEALPELAPPPPAPQPIQGLLANALSQYVPKV